MEKQISNKGNGSLLRGIRNRMFATLNGAALKKALNTLPTPVKEVKRLPQEVRQKLLKVAQETGSVVLVLSERSRNWRVYSVDGYQAVRRNAKKNKPWTKRGNVGKTSKTQPPQAHGDPAPAPQGETAKSKVKKK